MNAKEIARLLGLLKAADPKVVTQMIQDDPSLIGKAHAVELEAEEVPDLLTAGHLHTVPSREEIKTGPAQSASGSGAERMIREYSRPAPQEGVTTEAMKLGEIFENFRKSLNALVEASKTQTSALAALLAAKAEKEDDEDDDEKEAKAHSKGRASTLIERAKKLLAKAEDEEEKEDDEDDDSKAKAHRKAARGFKRRASTLLGKAQIHAMAADDADLKKSIRLIAAKADIVVKAEDEDDEKDEEKDEKSEKARAEAEAAAKAAAEAAAKAEADKNAEGNQNDKQDKESGNQSDSAKAVAAMQGKVDEALKGLTTLQGSVATLMDAVSGRSRNAPAGAAPTGAAARPDLFEFVKADPQGALAALRTDIDKAVDTGALDGNQQMHAMNLLAKVDAFHRGVIAKSVVDGMLATAPTAVKQIFEKAA